MTILEWKLKFFARLIACNIDLEYSIEEFNSLGDDIDLTIDPKEAADEEIAEMSQEWEDPPAEGWDYGGGVDADGIQPFPID